MILTVEAVYDGAVPHPDKALELKPNTRVRITLEVVQPAESTTGSFLDTASSLNLSGPADWSANIDKYLYGDSDKSKGEKGGPVSF